MERVHKYDKFKGQFLKAEKDMQSFEKLILSIILNYEQDKIYKEIEEENDVLLGVKTQERMKRSNEICYLAERYGLDV